MHVGYGRPDNTVYHFAQPTLGSVVFSGKSSQHGIKRVLNMGECEKRCWILGSRNALRSVNHDCFQCTKLTSKFLIPNVETLTKQTKAESLLSAFVVFITLDYSRCNTTKKNWRSQFVCSYVSAPEQFTRKMCQHWTCETLCLPSITFLWRNQVLTDKGSNIVEAAPELFRLFATLNEAQLQKEVVKDCSNGLSALTSRQTLVESVNAWWVPTGKCCGTILDLNRLSKIDWWQSFGQ